MGCFASKVAAADESYKCILITGESRPNMGAPPAPPRAPAVRGQPRAHPPPPACCCRAGASSGIGAALARRFAAPGALLALTGRSQARLELVAQACRRKGAEVGGRSPTGAPDCTAAQAAAGMQRRRRQPARCLQP
jgi:hypothetical protein